MGQDRRIHHPYPFARNGRSPLERPFLLPPPESGNSYFRFRQA